MKSPKFRDTAGFTLMEMLTAITVAMILMSIALPAFTKLLPGIRLSSAARQIATDLQLVRMRAIAQHANQTVTFNPDTATYTFGTDTRNLSQLYPGTTIITADNPTFNTMGTAALATIKVGNNGQQACVQVNPIGRVDIPAVCP
jgi:Tfp pilus assembly protein FimT